MLAARGVSLGLTKIKLNELPINDKFALGKYQRAKGSKKSEEKPKIHIKKHVDKKTLWTACRIVIGGMAIMVLGLLMTVMGYFDRDLAAAALFNSTTGISHVIVDDSLRYKLKSMQYIGPIMMGVGMFMLIISCVITLESRDRHAQIIQETSDQIKREASRREQNTRKRKDTKSEGQHPDAHHSVPPSGSLRFNGKVQRSDEPQAGDPSAETAHRGEHKRSDTAEAMIMQKKKPSNAPCTGASPTKGCHHEVCGTVPGEEAMPSAARQEEIRVNRSLPKRKAPLVKDESLSTSLMTSPSNSPRPIGATTEPSTTAMTRE